MLIVLWRNMIERLFNPTLARLVASLLPPPAISRHYLYSLSHPPFTARRGASHLRQVSASNLAPSLSSSTLPPLPNTIFSNFPSNTLESTALDHMEINESHFCSLMARYRQMWQNNVRSKLIELLWKSSNFVSDVPFLLCYGLKI